MPLYEYGCHCGNKEELFKKIDDRTEAVHCIQCGSFMYRKISPPRINTWKPIEVELETNKPKVYQNKRELKEDCERLGKSMPGLDINI